MGKFQSFLNEQVLLESGFSRIAQIMSGLVPSVKSFAIITWENPMGKKISDDENEKRNTELKDLLKRGSYGFRQIKGKYGNMENPFFIMNISKNEARDIGKQGEQDSILFGKIKKEFDITFQLVYCFKDEVEERHVWKSLEKGTTDFYSEYKGRKFYVPFFDDTYETAKFEKGKIVKEEFNIFIASDFPIEIVKEVERIADQIDILNEEVSGKHKWLYRGLAHSTLSKSAKL